MEGYQSPWWFMYPHVYYDLNGRMATRVELRDLIPGCRATGVHVYADAVVNHMTGGGNDVSTSATAIRAT
jgi:alpha-amylase